MKFIGFIVVVVMISLAICSCDGSGKNGKKTVKGKSQSAPYELLVVADKEWLKGSAGQALLDVVEGPIIGLPQYESQFRCTKINRVGFNRRFKVYRNIVIADVGKKYKEAEMGIAFDEYCKPQVIVYLSAPNDKEFIRLIAERHDQLLDILNQQEFTREHGLLKKKYSGAVKRQAEKQFGVSILVPQDIDDVKAGKDFFWASSIKQEFKLNICMYSLPLRNLSLDEFVAVRDSVMKINIPGGKEGQWMETDGRTVSYSVGQMPDGQRNVVQVRGLWDMRGDAMGGPFVAYLLEDVQNDRMLVAEGFVFAPDEKKRPLIRELEAALQTLTVEH